MQFSLCLPSQQRQRMLREHITAFAVPCTLLNSHLLLPLHVSSRHIGSGDRVDSDRTSTDALDVGLKVLSFMDVDDNYVDKAIVTQGRADVQPGSVLDAAQPRG